MTITRPIYQLTVMVLFFLMTGCMMVRGDNLRVPSKWPPDKPAEMKSIGLLVKAHVQSGGSTQPTPPQIMQVIEGQAQKAYSDSALFTHVTLAKQSADLLADIQVSEEGSKALAGISGFISGFTLGLIPGYANATLTTVTVFKNQSGMEIGTIKKSESVSFWIQLFLVAAMPFWDEPKVVVREIYYDLNRATLDEARAKGFL